MEPMLLIAISLFIIMGWLTLDIAIGSRRLGSLSDIAPISATDVPQVSIIVPACNEAETIAPALATLLAQQYAKLEIIVVNDRSTDATGEILREMQQRHPGIIILDIHELPEGWLGKHHALHCGAALAQGDILLFTDADIHMAPDTVARAVHRLEQAGLDHLCLIFKNKAKGWLLNSLILDAGGGLFLLFKPWLASNPRSKRFMGVGAFNMVRRLAYEQVGGHSAIKTHPIDDLMLGKIIKEAGLRQECLSGYDFVTVSWYHSTGAMIDGLMKNIFALANFNTALALGGALGISLLTILPPWGVLLCHGSARLFFALTVALRLTFFSQAASHSGLSPWLAPAALVTPYVTVYTILKATFTTLKNNSISWRGSRYSLDELRRKNRSLL
ncbi:MAG: glycosyltransferase family 2 protein [Deltaproteobacteria bacterium]|nr:glycosyltransferase family 2 protein [Deltaproteobacteria bacterium]